MNSIILLLTRKTSPVSGIVHDLVMDWNSLKVDRSLFRSFFLDKTSTNCVALVKLFTYSSYNLKFSFIFQTISWKVEWGDQIRRRFSISFTSVACSRHKSRIRKKIIRHSDSEIVGLLLQGRNYNNLNTLKLIEQSFWSAITFSRPQGIL